MLLMLLTGTLHCGRYASYVLDWDIALWTTFFFSRRPPGGLPLTAASASNCAAGLCFGLNYPNYYGQLKECQRIAVATMYSRKMLKQYAIMALVTLSTLSFSVDRPTITAVMDFMCGIKC
ncbi:uncharacterized protein LOC110727340 [Chenopodium quinoa]|uniref:uncharacterized protein LOC110722333 n=1 Tax=Chenopodium quinoa TaxID=63459 RepID=UPI000B797D49|nr:uncharacterized protein LOC110722333 [Chenopodium quinoa]XP_021762596.1 uncharacterized protein LOC110727340 [Chenopodium quinoa]